MFSADVSCVQQFSAIQLDLPYRGDRTYLHSADIFAALGNLAHDQFAPDAFVSELVIRRRANRQARISFRPDPEAFGTFSIHARGVPISGWLVNTGVPVLTRVPYDELPAEMAVVAGPGRASFAGPIRGYTAFERLLVLLKVAGGKYDAWICQISLRAPLLDSELTAVFQQKLGRFLLLRSCRPAR